MSTGCHGIYSILHTTLLQDTHEAFMSLKGNRELLHITLVDISKTCEIHKILVQQNFIRTWCTALQEVVNTSPEETVAVERM